MKLAFLRAQLAGDERTARRVKSIWRQVGDTGVIIASDGKRAEECANGNWAGIAEHIVRHDPEQVLSVVKAKRRTLERHAQCGTGRGHCDDGGHAHADGGCPDLDDLLLAYADRLGFEDEWRP
ncbi:DUF6221 family protein [Streptomyces lavendofoliae]|nr:DUF6221 family protein [Streptomyces lavendofoliae]